MEAAWPEEYSGDRRHEAIIEQLVRGKDFTNQLQILIGYGGGSGGGSRGETPDDLVAKILRSFTEALSMLNCGGGDSEEVASEVPDTYCNSRLNSPCSDGGRRSEESGESCKTSALKDRRGSYKRRKTSNTWSQTIPTLVDDGYAWRKYGQKVILNAKHPRNYYRCTHKFDQGCQATKQVQKTEGEPAMYQITYNGNHTCRNLLKGPHLILDVEPTTTPARDDSSSNSILLSFESKYQSSSSNPFFSSSSPSPPSPLINHIQEDAFPYGDPSHYNHVHSQSPPSDHHHQYHLFSPDPTPTADYSAHVAFLSSSDGGRVVSRTASSSRSLDLDILVGSVDLFTDDVLQFDF